MKIHRYDEYINESLDLDNKLLDASNKGDVNNVKELLDSGADKEAKDGDGNTPLILASRYEYAEVATRCSC